jgi:hypothetical protein
MILVHACDPSWPRQLFALTQSGDLFDYAKDLFVGAKQAVLAALG